MNPILALIEAIDALGTEPTHVSVHRILDLRTVNITCRTNADLQTVVNRLGLAPAKLERGSRYEWLAAHRCYGGVILTAYGEQRLLTAEEQEERAA